MASAPKFSPAEVSAISDAAAAAVIKAMPAGLAWILIVAEPGHEGALRSNYTERAAVAHSLRETVRTVYGDA